MAMKPLVTISLMPNEEVRVPLFPGYTWKMVATKDPVLPSQYHYHLETREVLSKKRTTAKVASEGMSVFANPLHIIPTNLDRQFNYETYQLGWKVALTHSRKPMGWLGKFRLEIYGIEYFSKSAICDGHDAMSDEEEEGEDHYTDDSDEEEDPERGFVMREDSGDTMERMPLLGPGRLVTADE